jgi:hypothetical protein
MAEFKEKHSLEARKAEAQRIMREKPSHYPLVVFKQAGSLLPNIEKPSILMEKSTRLLHLLSILRRGLNANTKLSLYLTAVQGATRSLLKADSLLEEVYDRHHDEDGFLYIEYGSNEAF